MPTSLAGSNTLACDSRIVLLVGQVQQELNALWDERIRAIDTVKDAAGAPEEGPQAVWSGSWLEVVLSIVLTETTTRLLGAVFDAVLSETLSAAARHLVEELTSDLGTSVVERFVAGEISRVLSSTGSKFVDFVYFEGLTRALLAERDEVGNRISGRFASMGFSDACEPVFLLESLRSAIRRQKAFANDTMRHTAARGYLNTLAWLDTGAGPSGVDLTQCDEGFWAWVWRSGLSLTKAKPGHSHARGVLHVRLTYEAAARNAAGGEPFAPRYDAGIEGVDAAGNLLLALHTRADGSVDRSVGELGIPIHIEGVATLPELTGGFDVAVSPEGAVSLLETSGQGQGLLLRLARANGGRDDPAFGARVIASVVAGKRLHEIMPWQ